MAKSPDMKAKLLSITRLPFLSLNYLTKVTGIGAGFHKDVTREQLHSPKAQAKILTDYEGSIKVQGLEEPVEKWLNGITAQLKTIGSKTPGLADLKKQINANTDLTEEDKKSRMNFCEKAENDLLTKKPSVELENFKERMNILSDLVKRDQENNPRAIVAYIDDEYFKLIKQMETDSKIQLENVDLYFNNINDLLPSQSEEYLSMKTELKNRIQASFDKAKAELDTLYEKGTPAATDKDKAVPSLRETFGKKVVQAEKELCNLVLYAEHTDSKAIPASENLTAGAAGTAVNKPDSRKYRDIDFKTYLEAKPERSSAWLSATAWSDYLKFLNNQKHDLVTPGGLILRHTETGVSISIPMSYSLYHQYFDDQLEADLLTIMNELVARGKDEVTITIDCQDETLCQKLIEKAYVAARLAGLPDDKIKFNVSGFKDKEQNITGKTATEIMSRLGGAPGIAQIKLNSWNQQKMEIQKAAEPKLRSDVAKLDKKINDILGDKTISAEVIHSEEASSSTSSTPFSVRR